MKIKRRSEEQWRAIINAYESSGLNGAEYCRQQGLNSKSFYRATAKYKTSKPSTRFVEARMPDKPDSGALTITLPHGQITCPVGVSPTWLAELFKALAK